MAVCLQSAQRHAHDQQMVEGYTQAAVEDEDDPASSWGQRVRRDAWADLDW
ncbi:MAG TPA: hypothetical protein VMM13_04550 [Euzebya sp.]|nr:hypothetical protein [Euzebya sp.]